MQPRLICPTVASIRALTRPKILPPFESYYFITPCRLGIPDLLHAPRGWRVDCLAEDAVDDLSRKTEHMTRKACHQEKQYHRNPSCRFCSLRLIALDDLNIHLVRGRIIRMSLDLMECEVCGMKYHQQEHWNSTQYDGRILVLFSKEE